MALTDETVSVAIEMVDGVSEPAESAANALANLKASIDKDTKALGEMQRALTQLNKATNPNKEHVKALEDSIKKLKDRVASSRSEFIGMGGVFGRSYKPTKDLKDKFNELAQAARTLPGPFGRGADLLQKLVNSKHLAKVAAFALAGALVLVGTALVRASIDLAQFALRAQEARRSELLMLEATSQMPAKMSAAFSAASVKAGDLQRAVDEVAGSVSIGRERVAQYAAQLARAGVQGANIKSALQAVATAASGWGEEQANQTAAWATSLAKTGGNVAALAQRVQSQIGGVVRKQMLSSEVQARKLAESYDSLFADVNIDGLLVAKKQFNDLFAQSTASGQVLRRFLGTLVQPLIDGLASLQRLFKITVQEIIIACLLAENAWLRFQLNVQAGIQVLKDTFPRVTEGIDAIVEVVTKLGSAVLDSLGGEWREVLAAAAVVLLVTLAPALWAATTAAIAFAGGVLSAVGSVIVAAATIAWPFLLAVAAVYLVIKAVEMLWDLFTNKDWAQLGIQIIDGFVNGIKQAWKIFKDAMSDIADAGIGAFKSVFGMKSPSRVMAELGVNVVKGFEGGVQSESDAAQSAVSGIATPPELGAAAPAVGRVASINIATLNVQVSGSATQQDAQGIAQSIKRELEAILETVAIQMGAPAS